VEIIQKESAKLIKNHQTIIDTMTKSTKSQLRRYIGPLINPEDIERFVGGIYGKFLSLLCAPKERVCEQIVEFATKGIGCDQSALISGICILSGANIKKLSVSLEHSCGSTLTSIISGNTKKRSALQLFLLRITTGSRDDSNLTNKELALQQADIVNSFTIKSIDDLFNVICDNSRAQCALIGQACKELFNTTFEDIILAKLSGSISKAIILWVLPVPEAIAFAIKENSKNSTAVAYLVACISKREIIEIDNANKSRYQKSLRDTINSLLSGRLKSAALSWIEKPSLDGGYEEQLEEYVNDQLTIGRSLIEILLDDESSAVVKDALRKQITCYASKGYQVDVHPELLTGSSDSSSSPMKSSPSKAFPPKLLSSSSLANAKSSPSKQISRPSAIKTELSDKIEQMISPRVEKHLQSRRHAESKNYEEVNLIQSGMKEEVKMATQYLRLVYASFDPQFTGRLPADTFWQFFACLDLESMGYTTEEREGIREWCDWSIDGYVSLADVQHELVDLIMNGLENQGLNTVDELHRRIKELSPGSVVGTTGFTPRTITPRNADNSSSQVPPDLYQYIWDTFDAYDVHKRGKLDSSEFWQLLTAMNLGFTDSDINAMQVRHVCLLFYKILSELVDCLEIMGC
jgi:hypothetical protein